MHATAYQRFDPLLPDGNAMLHLAEAFGEYGAYRVDSIGDARGEEPAVPAARADYFRETYACNEPLVSGIEPFLHHEGLAEAARRIHGRPLVRPTLVYANLLAPGQELALHTDVPEFRGLHREKDPAWLLVAMHHSGLFDAWRVRVATAVAWFGRCRGGGAFCFYPDGPYGQPVALPVRHNTAIALDTDSVIHGVDRVSEQRVALPPLHPGTKLRYTGDDRWEVHDPETGATLAEVAWDDLRLSVSWKACCYADADEERAARDHSDDLTRERAIERLCEDLRRRGRIGSAHPDDAELALAAVDAYVPFPPRPPEPDAPA